MDREQFAGNILTFVPFMFKRLMKTFNNMDVSRQQLGLLFHIFKENGKPMSYYSEKMMIPKSNLTVISDRLIKEGYIAREFDPADRRIIILRLTESGEQYLNEQKKIATQEMVNRLDKLSDAEVIRLNELINEIKDIFQKLDQ